MILVIDFESQYTQLIAKCVRKLHVFCEVVHYGKMNDQSTIDTYNDVDGIICSGGSHSVTDDTHPTFQWDKWTHIPILTICYSSQLRANHLGAHIITSECSEFGRTEIFKTNDHFLWDHIDALEDVWMSHKDTIMFDYSAATANVVFIADSDVNDVIAFQSANVTSILFHPEVTHSKHGTQMIHNFLHHCHCDFTWIDTNIVEKSIREIREKVGTDNVIMAVSGGVDSTVAANIIHNAIGNQLSCVFINNGLLRKNEYADVLESYDKIGLHVYGIDESDFFLESLRGVSDPEKKRKIIGSCFIDVFSKYVANCDIPIAWLGQGTIYPDVIESNSGKHVIKSHHNVGGLPEHMNFSLIEPLRHLFKDEVRRIGAHVGIPDSFVYRHPYPGPGLAIRIIGEVTPDKINIIQSADAIFINLLKEHLLYSEIWQAGVILLDTKSVGVMGDCRTYGYTVALRAVTSIDGMTADVYPIPYDILKTIMTRIVNEVECINRVVYDITTKPPGTIEWE